MPYDAEDHPPLPCHAVCFACGAAFYGEACPCAGRPAPLPVDGRDPKVIAELLELAALFLTPHEDAEFTREELIAETRAIDPAIILRDDDIDAVLASDEYLRREVDIGHYAPLLRKVGDDKYVMA